MIDPSTTKFSDLYLEGN